MKIEKLFNRVQILSGIYKNLTLNEVKCEFKYSHKGYVIVERCVGTPSAGYETSVFVYSAENLEDEVNKCASVEEAESYIDYLMKDIMVKPKFTAEAILTSSQKAKILARQGVLARGVLSNKEQKLYMKTTFGFQVISNNEVFFFTDDYTLGHGLLPKEFVPSSTICPHTVVPRDELPSGIVQTIDDFIKVYYKGKRQIQTIDELVEYLNTKYA